jgi:hydrophobic/amphiphilic exporter-1 (mainly G- bacteria), HAE1 family
MKLTRYPVAHPVIIAMTLLALGVFGLMCLANTNTEFLPDISNPMVYVVTVYPGASSKDIEETVTNVLEEDFVTLPNFKSMSSQSINSASIISITYQDGVDPYDEIDEVRNRIDDLIDDLPDGIQGRPYALVGGTSMLSIASFVVESEDGDINALGEYIENEIKPQLTQISGVSTITVNGAKTPTVDVKLRMDDLNSKGISPIAVYQMLSYNNYSIPLDSVNFEGSSIDAKFDSTYSSLEEIASIPVGYALDGGIIRLSDVADISLDYKDDDYLVTKDGKEVISVDICKRSDGNTIEITNQIKQILEEEEAKYGGALKFTMISDDSTLVNSSLSTVIESGVLGVIIAVLVIYIFLSDFKATIIIGLSIPLSIFFTFIGMQLMGITINLLSLSGIVVALGNIVGAAILVLDQVYRYYQQTKEGKALYSVNESIFLGTDNVMGSVMGSGLTTIVVFLPIAMMSGLVGQILKDVSVTFMLSLSASLLVAIIYIPFLMKKLLKEDDSVRTPKRENIVVRGLKKVEKAYAKSLYFVEKHIPFMLVMAILVVALSIYILPNMEFTFIPSTDNGDFYVNVEMPQTYSLEETRQAMDKIEQLIIDNVPELKADVVFSGKDMSTLSQAAKNKGAIHVVLTSVKDRDRDIHDIILQVQKLLAANIPDATISVQNGGFDRLINLVSNGGGYGLMLVGEDEDELYEAAQRIEEQLKTYPEVMTTSISATNDMKSAVINGTYDYLTSLGVPAQEAGLTAAILFYGTDVGKYSQEGSDDRYDIHLYSDIQDEELTADRLNDITVTSLAGATIPLANITTLDLEESLSQINHDDRATSLTVSATLTTESTDSVTKKINQYLEENPLPTGISTKTSGLGEMVETSLTPMIKALLIAMFLVYLVMVAVFERFDQPFLIMLLFPFCIIGAVVALSIFNSSMSIVSILGIVSLIGMLVNNGIVIADYANLARKQDREKLLTMKGIKFDEYTETVGMLSQREEMAILDRETAEGSASRLRAILMTTLTTVLGVIPMAVAKGEGAEIYAPLGQVIMGGLATSMILTLYIMPTYYYLLERGKLKRVYKKKAAKVAEEENKNEEY